MTTDNRHTFINRVTPGHSYPSLTLHFNTLLCKVGTAVAQWLWCCATNRKVGGSTPDFPLLIPTEADDDSMDRGPPSSIPPLDTATPLSCRLHGFPETCPLERVPSTNLETHSRQVPGGALAPPPLAPDSLHPDTVVNRTATTHPWKTNTPPQGITRTGGDTT